MTYQTDYGSRERALARAIVDEMVARGVGGGDESGGGNVNIAQPVNTNGNVKTAIAESLPAGENFLGVIGGRTALVQTSFARPADTTAYAVGDAVMNSTSAPSLITFPNAARIAAGSGIIVGARLAKSSNVITNATFRLWLYTGAPTTIPNDNAPFGQAWANRTVRLGYIDFTAPIQGSDCASYFGSFTNSQLAYKLPSGTAINGILQALGAYSPASGEQFFLELSCLQD